MRVSLSLCACTRVYIQSRGISYPPLDERERMRASFSFNAVDTFFCCWQTEKASRSLFFSRPRCPFLRSFPSFLSSPRDETSVAGSAPGKNGGQKPPARKIFPLLGPKRIRVAGQVIIPPRSSHPRRFSKGRADLEIVLPST